MRSEDPTVYSTEQGRICPGCGHPTAGCTCKRSSPIPAGDGIVRVSRDSKRRKGKIVTLVTGVRAGNAALRELTGELKRRCSAGGAVKDGVIEIQGDHRDTIFEILRNMGMTVKKAGG